MHTPTLIAALTAALVFAPVATLAAEHAAAKPAAKAAAKKPAKPAAPAAPVFFVPPDEDTLPNDKFGELVKRGKALFMDTQQRAPHLVGNGMNCVNCHLDAGRKAGSGPLWAAYTMYPAYRKKNDKVNSMEERIQGCFTFSMNGTPPALGSDEMNALMAYHYWVSKGAPVGVELPGRGFPTLAKPAQAPDIKRGERVYANNCAVCHGAKGEGVKVGARYAFPPLWGRDSFNWGAGMHRVNTAASFIKANMPLGKPNSLSDQDAWDVAAYMNSKERPADPREKEQGSVAQNKKTHHDEQCFYGDHVDGDVLDGK